MSTIAFMSYIEGLVVLVTFHIYNSKLSFWYGKYYQMAYIYLYDICIKHTSSISNSPR